MGQSRVQRVLAYRALREFWEAGLADAAEPLMVWYKLEEDFTEGCHRLARIMGAPEGSDLAFESEALEALLHSYQARNHERLPDASPIEVVRFVMKDRGLKPKDLVAIFGNAPRVSDFWNGRRELSKAQVKRLHDTFDIPYDCHL